MKRGNSTILISLKEDAAPPIIEFWHRVNKEHNVPRIPKDLIRFIQQFIQYYSHEFVQELAAEEWSCRLLLQGLSVTEINELTGLTTTEIR